MTTSESLFNLTERPPRVTVVGPGAVGLEMAQALALLGSQARPGRRGVTRSTLDGCCLSFRCMDFSRVYHASRDVDSCRLLGGGCLLSRFIPTRQTRISGCGRRSRYFENSKIYVIFRFS